ncbi:MAG TPA: hypothetical protein VLF39_03960 [Candidatus Saccharimonadales bacterium]|nr:hypothetical protein [Candidatus Saccharimonadales bacterium]
MELKDDPEDNSRYIVTLVNENEVNVVLGASRERSENRIRLGNEPLEFDRDLCGILERGSKTVKFGKETINHTLLDGLIKFHEQTMNVVNKQLETIPAFQNSSFIQRHELGRVAGEMVTELSGLVKVSNFLDELDGGGF